MRTERALAARFLLYEGRIPRRALPARPCEETPRPFSKQSIHREDSISGARRCEPAYMILIRTCRLCDSNPIDNLVRQERQRGPEGGAMAISGLSRRIPWCVVFFTRRSRPRGSAAFSDVEPGLDTLTAEVRSAAHVERRMSPAGRFTIWCGPHGRLPSPTCSPAAVRPRGARAG